MKSARPLLLPFAWLSGTALAAPAASTPPMPVVVRTVPVEYSSAAVPVRVSGVLSRRAETTLSFKITGIIESLDVRAGDSVAKDQVLARLQPDEIEAQVAQARSALEKARRDQARAEKLVRDAVATLENLQDVRTAVEQAEAQLRIAEFNRLHSVIRAPSAGRILRRGAEPHELVAAGRPILDFAGDGDGWIVRAGLADRDVARVRLGDRAEMRCGADEAILGGRITQISESADAVTRTTEIEIALEVAPATARSGFVSGVTVLPSPVAERPIVPAATLIEGDGGKAVVFVLEPGATTAKRVAVEIEALLGTQAFLRTVLPRTAQLVVAGGEYLRDGAPVAVVP